MAIFGGNKVRPNPMPYRESFGPAEETKLLDAVRYYRDNNVDPPYGGNFEKQFCDEFVKFMGVHHLVQQIIGN